MYMATSTNFIVQFTAKTSIDKKSLNEAKQSITKEFNKITLDFGTGKSRQRVKAQFEALTTAAVDLQKQYIKAIQNGNDELASGIKDTIDELRTTYNRWKAEADAYNRSRAERGLKTSTSFTTKATNKNLKTLKKYDWAGDMATQVGEYNRNLDVIKKANKSGEESVQSLGQTFENIINQISPFNVSITDAAGNITKASVAAAALSAAITALINVMQKMVQTTIELNTHMTELQMVTVETGKAAYESFDEYNEIAKELGVTTANVIDGANEWARQGRTAAETTELIRASTIQATIANMDYATSSKLLTATLNGYQKSADEAMNVVDALSAVDMAAATSVEELAEALQRTANSARLAGVDFETLIAYIAAVIDTSQLAPEVVGTAFKTMFARMSNVKAGVNVDESGESLDTWGLVA